MIDAQKIRTPEDAISALEAYQEFLYERAVEEADKFWDVIYDRNPKLDWDKRSRMFLRCRKVGNSIQIEWYENRWVGSKEKKTLRAIRTHISKPKSSYTYTASVLTALAQDWEVDMVLATEKRMAEYRREAAAVTRALAAFRPLLDRQDKDGP